MNLKLVAIAICVIVLATGAFTLSARSSNDNSVHKTDGALPARVVYEHLFRHVAALKKQAAAADAKGEDGAKFRDLYKYIAQLDDQQARKLEEIASEFERDAAQQDQAAKAVIDAYRSANPRSPAKGEMLPPPPPELSALQDARNAVASDAVDRVRAALGEQKFQQFNEFVQRTIGPRVTTVPSARQRPEGKRQPSLLPPGAQLGSNSKQGK